MLAAIIVSIGLLVGAGYAYYDGSIDIGTAAAIGGISAFVSNGITIDAMHWRERKKTHPDENFGRRLWAVIRVSEYDIEISEEE